MSLTLQTIGNTVYVCCCRYQTKTSQTILDSILSIQPKDSSGGSGETRESVVYRLADDMLDKLPNDYIPYEVKQRLQKMGALQPMVIFLRQEIDRCARLVFIANVTVLDNAAAQCSNALC